MRVKFRMIFGIDGETASSEYRQARGNLAFALNKMPAMRYKCKLDRSFCIKYLKGG